MSQMTNFRKVLGACLAVFVLMGAQSCNRDVAEPSSLDGKTQAEETIYKEGTEEMPISETLTFDFSEEENQLKALNATVSATTGTNNRHGVAYANKIPVVCIVRSNQGDPVTYVDNVEIIKQANGTYKFAKDRIHLAQGSSLAAGKKWYLMVVTQNSFNKNNGELSVNATGAPENLSPSATREMDIPSASPWIELPMFPNGQPKWSKDWDANRKAKRLKLYPQGVLCRATLRLDDAYKTKLGSDNVDLKITQLKVVSTALSFSGKFKFDKNSLPPITQTEGRPTIAWEPTQTASTAKEYRALDANTPEYQKVFNNPNGVLRLSGSGSLTTIFADSNNPARVDKTNLPAGVKSILFWAVPVKGVTNRHTTLIAETGESTLPNKVLAPSHTYIYGKKHTKDADQGRAVYFDAVYYNPYTPLDYMAEYNVARKDPGQFQPGGKIPQGWSGAFASDHTPNSSTFLQWWDIDNISLTKDNRTYSNPTHGQFHSVIPYSGDAALNLKGGGPVNDALVKAQLGDKTSDTKFSSRKKGDANVRYALALTDFGGSQKYRVAYRYELKEYQQTYPVNYLSLRKRVLSSRVANRTPPYFIDAANFERAGAPVYFKRIELEIKAVQLGADFVGSVDDIANEDFWSTANLRTEVRILPQSYSAYRSYLYPDDIDDNVGRRIKEDIFRSYGDNNWGASYATLGRENEATPFYLGDNILAIFAPSAGVWANADMRAKSQYVALRFPVRLFTKQER